MKTLNLASVLLIILSTQSLYAKPLKAEKFSATENNGTPQIVNANTPVEQNLIDEQLDDIAVENKAANERKTKNVTHAPTTSIVEVKPIVETKDDEKFDIVPSSKIPEIAERVKYAYDILKRFGRAYDYRTTTLTELKKILQDLENNSDNNSNLKKS